MEGDEAAGGLRYMHPEHQANARVLPADVRLPLPQLDVRVAELEDAGAVDTVR